MATTPAVEPAEPLYRPNWAELKFGGTLRRLAVDARDRVQQRNPGAQAKTDRLKAEVWATLNDASHSRLAWTTITFICACILLSTACFVIETVPEWERSEQWAERFYFLEIFFVIVFTVEIGLRIWSTPETVGQWFKNPLNAIDVIAILPFYIEVAMSILMGMTGVTIDLRVLRALRMFRLLKTGRYSEQLQFMVEAAVRSQKSFILLVSVMCLSLVFFSCVMWLLEKGRWDPALQCHAREDEPNFNGCSPFSSIPTASWWAITTLTTVGYGDAFPVTPWGKVVGGIAFLAAILCVALPIGVLSVEFTDLYDQRIQAQKKAINEKSLRRRSKKELELYLSVEEFDELRADIEDNFRYIRLLALAHAESLGRKSKLDPGFAMLQKQALTDLQNVKDAISAVSMVVV